jgi:hypothetical protein
MIDASGLAALRSMLTAWPVLVEQVTYEFHSDQSISDSWSNACPPFLQCPLRTVDRDYLRLQWGRPLGD